MTFHRFDIRESVSSLMEMMLRDDIMMVYRKQLPVIEDSNVTSLNALAG